VKLKILLPTEVFTEVPDVTRVVAETSEGSFGLLPRRRDCVAGLVPGVLAYETAADGEVFVAVDCGTLAKVGAEVSVSVRRAIAGSNLDQLRAAVETEFRSFDESEVRARDVMNKLETGFLRRFAAFQQHE